MAKTKQQAAQRPRPAARVEPDRMNRLLLIGGVAAVVAIALGFIAFGWYQTQIKPWGKTVLEVGDTKVSLGEVKRRAEQALKENEFFTQSQEILLALPQTMLLTLEREAKLLQAADELGVTVTDEDVRQEIRTQGNLGPLASAEDFTQELKRQVDESGLHQEEYLQQVRAGLLELKARDQFTTQAPASEEQVRFRWIVAADEAQGQQALQGLEDGDNFAAVAAEFSQESASAAEGGVVDWQLRGGFPDQEIEDWVFSAGEGERSELFSTDSGFIIVELLQRNDDRRLSDEQKQQVGNRELQAWLDGLDSKLTVVQDFTDEDRNRILNDIL